MRQVELHQRLIEAAEPRAGAEFSIGQAETEILAWCSERLQPPNPLAVDTDLLDAGLLDSLLVMDLFTRLVNRYGIGIEDSAVSPRNFRTVRAMAQMVGERLNAAGPCAVESP